jgi:RNA polymerase-interacting CarD/CdnL/TRCF family regulator
MEEVHIYSEGEWIVHSRYGIGKIEGVDVKEISGEKTDYFRITTTDSIYWMPVNQMDSDVLRPLASPEEIDQAIVVLQKPPEEMSPNFQIRQNRIQKTQMDNTPDGMAELIRDLRAYRREKGVLNSTERSAFRTLKSRLIQEWAIVTGVRTEKVESELNNMIDL